MYEIIDSVGFIGEGVQFPPLLSQKRLKDISLNIERYEEGNKKKKGLSVCVENNGRIEIDCNISTLNYYKLVTNKFLSLLLLNKPNICCTCSHTNTNTNEHQDKLEEFLSGNFYSALQDCMQNFSMCGEGYLQLYLDNKGKVKVSNINPAYVYKVVSKENIREIESYVVCIVLKNYNYVSNKEEIYGLKVQEHKRGYYKEYIREYNGVRLGKLKEENKVVNTGLEDFAIYSFSNNITSVGVYGVSDYKHIEDLVCEKERRLALISNILDKFSSPTLETDISNFKENQATGQLEAKVLGNVVAVRRDGAETKYITWDANLESSFKALEVVNKELATISELGVMLTGDFKGVPSTKTMRLLLKSSLDMVSRKIDTIDVVLKRLFKEAINAVSSVKISNKDVRIEWREGLEEHIEDISNVINSRVGAGTLSVQSALMREGYSKEQAIEEYELIKKEKGSGIDG